MCRRLTTRRRRRFVAVELRQVGGAACRWHKLKISRRGQKRLDGELSGACRRPASAFAVYTTLVGGRRRLVAAGGGAHKRALVAAARHRRRRRRRRRVDVARESPPASGVGRRRALRLERSAVASVYLQKCKSRKSAHSSPPPPPPPSPPPPPPSPPPPPPSPPPPPHRRALIM